MTRPGRAAAGAAASAATASAGVAVAVVADFPDVADAERLAARLVVEGVRAEVWEPGRVQSLLPSDWPPSGPAVVVARYDHGHALALAQLFDQVDRGACAVAPPPRDLWHGPAWRPAIATFALVTLALAVCVLLVAASGG